MALRVPGVEIHQPNPCYYYIIRTGVCGYAYHP